ncbi:MAG: hypothetical protein P8176_14770 [Gammaproteobacteria bacterium]
MWILTSASIFVGTLYFVMGFTMFIAPHKFYKFMGYLWAMTPALESQTKFAGLWHFGYSIPLLVAGILGKQEVIRHLMVFGGYPLSLMVLYQQWNMIVKLKGMPPEKFKKLCLFPIGIMIIYTLALYYGS